MNTIAFMSANYVARQVGYNMTGGWGQGDRATSEYFQPLETFGERFGALLSDIRAQGFTAMDLWTSHLSPTWAMPEHIAIARDLLAAHGLRVVSLAGWFGATAAEFEATCRLAVAVGTEILGGSTALLERDRAALVALLEQHNVKLGVENHPEKTPAELLRKIGDGAGGRIGAAVDTGWFGTQGYDAADALRELQAQLLHVHLKDVLAAGAHDTCAFGKGIVPLQRCVQVLREIGYQGALSIEHEPEHSDPTADVAASYALLRGWLEEEARP